MAQSQRKILRSILEAVGNTPLIKLNRVTAGIQATVLAKLEFLNPGGSVKDRIGVSMLEAAEKQGLIRPGCTIVEPTSGNTGLGLALAALVKGYKVICTIPDKMSMEKINMLKALGARVIITPTAVAPDHPSNYVKVAERITRDEPNAFMPNQYFNPANPEIHYRTTGPEIWEQSDGEVTVFVAAMGTGGTISGAGKYLKERNPRIKVVGADPEGSIYHHEFYRTTGDTHPYKVEGIGEDFMPATLDLNVVDEMIVVSDREAFLTARRLARKEGIFAGGSAGAATFAALQVTKNLGEDQTAVVVLPDTGRNYMTKIYSDEWMCEHGFMDSAEERISVAEILKAKSSRIRKVIVVHPEDSLQTAITLMTRYDISQLPVVKDGVQVGSVAESHLVEKLCELPGKGRGERELKIEEVMASPLPTVKKTDSLLNPFLLLKDRNAILVLEHGEIVDIITSTDVVSYMMRR
ncbi:MAG: cystathionine beta-synthase [Calditrichaeota bacterium]|nr:cystathionine beta-synthase [Calditrichota bacterium]